MAIYGTILNRENPPFTIQNFLIWMPQYTKFMATQEGQNYFNEIYEIVNAKIFKSIFGTDWKLAMSYAIAHYLQLIANNLGAPSGSTLQEIAGGGTIKGILSSASVGSFSKSYDIDKTVISDKEATFWNQTSFGAALMALLQTKSVPSIMVVTSGPDYPPIKSPFTPRNDNNG